MYVNLLVAIQHANSSWACPHPPLSGAIQEHPMKTGRQETTALYTFLADRGTCGCFLSPQNSPNLPVTLQEQKAGAMRSASPVRKLPTIFHVISSPLKFQLFLSKFKMFTDYSLGQVSVKTGTSPSHSSPSFR